MGSISGLFLLIPVPYFTECVYVTVTHNVYVSQYPNNTGTLSNLNISADFSKRHFHIDTFKSAPLGWYIFYLFGFAANNKF